MAARGAVESSLVTRADPGVAPLSEAPASFAGLLIEEVTRPGAITALSLLLRLLLGAGALRARLRRGQARGRIQWSCFALCGIGGEWCADGHAAFEASGAHGAGSRRVDRPGHDGGGRGYRRCCKCRCRWRERRASWGYSWTNDRRLRTGGGDGSVRLGRRCAAGGSMIAAHEGQLDQIRLVARYGGVRLLDERAKGPL